MTAQEKHRGLVIRESDVGEADRIVTVLTDNSGVIRAFARGSKKIKSRLFSTTRIFTYGDFVFYRGRDKYIITEGRRITGFLSKTTDIVHIALAQYMCELCCFAVPQEHAESGDEILRLVLNAMYALENTDKPVKLIKASFELRMMALIGYRPEVSFCGECGVETDAAVFIPAEGRILCAECAVGPAAGVKLGPAALAAVRHVLSCDMKQLFAYIVSEESLNEMASAAEAYVTVQLERGFKTLDFFHSL